MGYRSFGFFICEDVIRKDTVLLSQRRYMGVMASEITGNLSVWSTTCIGWEKKIYQRSAFMALCKGNPPITGGFPSQRANNAARVFTFIRQAMGLSVRILEKTEHILIQCDAIWGHRSGSTLAQVMACCLVAPSNYLNQCCLIISQVLWHLLESNFTVNVKATIPKKGPVTKVRLSCYLVFLSNDSKTR